MNNQQRINWIDWSKVFAIYLVGTGAFSSKDRYRTLYILFHIFVPYAFLLFYLWLFI